MADGTLKVGTITTSSGSGNITIGSGVTLQNNVPAFFAFKDSSSNVTDSAFTTAVCNVETLDTNNGYDTSTGKYTIPIAGKYSISCSVTDEYDGLDIKTIEIMVE